MNVSERILEYFKTVDEVSGRQISGAQVERRYISDNLRKRCDKEIVKNAKGNRGEIASQGAVLGRCENPNALLPNAPLQKAYVNLSNKTKKQNNIKKLQQQQKEKARDHRDGTLNATKYLGSTEGRSYIDARVDAYLKKIHPQSPP